MNKLLLSATLVAAGTLGLSGVSFSHGGTYRGPGDTVPPGGGGGGGGGGPTSPGPSGPTSPGPSGPSTPGPAGPGSPGGAPSGGPSAPVSGGGGGGGPDLTAWTFWWEFNKEPYLNLKAHIHSGDVTTGSEGWFLGHGAKKQAKDSLRPTEEQIRQKVVPALLSALERETNNDIVTGCLIALAKIGDEKSESGQSEFELIIRKFLQDNVQEIRETAAVSLGILANDVSFEILRDLLQDAPAGRDALGKSEVNYRTRAFAAYGLGLLGARTGSDDVRTAIVTALSDTIENDSSKTRDLKVACVVAMGLVPVSTIEPETERGEKDPIEPQNSRVDQIDYLLEYLRNDDNRYLVRAHCPTALARLLDGIAGDVYDAKRAEVVEDLLERIGKRSKEAKEIQQSCVLALGLLGDTDADALDKEIRKAILGVPKDLSDQQARNYGMIAAAKLGGTVGTGDKAEDGIGEIVKYLQTQLSRGKTTIKPWVGLSIGVMGRMLQDQDITTGVNDLTLALRAALREEKSYDKVGAYAVGIGVLGDLESTDLLLEKLDRMKDDEARGYIAVSLGLMNARDAIEPIQKIIDESKYRPELLKQAAIALGLLGDKELVTQLLDMLTDAKGLATQAALSSALGFIGDQRSIDPLVEMLQNKDITEKARGFAAVALGIVADKEPLPWNSKIGVDLNYRASTTTLNDQEGTGILNIL